VSCIVLRSSLVAPQKSRRIEITYNAHAYHSSSSSNSLCTRDIIGYDWTQSDSPADEALAKIARRAIHSEYFREHFLLEFP
jgi:hypothetical protein